jgi:integrase
LEHRAPGHHGYQRACDLISGPASTGPCGSPAWRTGLEPFDDANIARNTVIDVELTHRLIAAAYEWNADRKKASAFGKVFGALVERLAVTGSRTSQVMRLSVGDLIDGDGEPKLMMPSSRKGRRRRKIERKAIPITSALAGVLREIAGDRPDDAPLLSLPVNKPGQVFARMVKTLGLDPTVITPYCFRHSNITRMLLAGVPVRVVASLHDTSVMQLERTYSKHIADHGEHLVRAALLQPEQPIADNVTRLPVSRRD